MSTIVGNESKTSLEGEIHCSYTWTIKDYENQISKRDVHLASDIFEFVDPDGRILKWRLFLCNRTPRTQRIDEADNDSYQGHIFLESLNDFDVTVVFLMSIVNIYSPDKPLWSKHTMFTSKAKVVFSKQNNSAGTPISSSTDENLRKFYKNWSCDGSLTVNCDISYKSEMKTEASCLSKRIHLGFVKDISTLLFDESYSDVEIKCGERRFPCHKIILSARSQVFRAMFQADMEENRSGKIEIKEYSPDVIKTLLHFVYTSSLDCTDQDHLVDLIQAADQYQLDLLKEACEVEICKGVDNKNCLIFLIIGDMHKAEKLKKISMKILVENINKVLMESPEDWKNCVKKYPELTVEITSELAKIQSMPSDPSSLTPQHFASSIFSDSIFSDSFFSDDQFRALRSDMPTNQVFRRNPRPLAPLHLHF